MTPRSLSLVLAIVAVVLAACAGSPAGPTARPVASREPVTTPEGAVAAVIAREPRLTGITELDPDLIGQGSFYEVMAASGVGAFVVNVTVGWGDCQAGCISRHEWLYAVQPDGTAMLQAETGDAVPNDAWPSPDGDGRTGVILSAVAGPVCPVETVPPEPGCAPRAVPGAVVIVRDVAGTEVQRVTLDAAGVAFLELEAGSYSLEGTPVEGLTGTPPSQSVTVTDGVGVPIFLAYDTGIR